MVTMNLTNDELVFLKRQLGRHARHVQDELAHTEARPMQHELAKELEQLESILSKLEPSERAS